jgi:hypothetical protein
LQLLTRISWRTRRLPVDDDGCGIAGEGVCCFQAITQLKLRRWNGKAWEEFGGLMNGADTEQHTWPGQHMRGFDQTELPETDLDAVIAYLRAMALESIRATPSGDGATRSEHNGSADLSGRGAHDVLEVTGQMRLVGKADVGCNVGESALGSTYERIRTADTCLQLVLVRGHADGALEGAQQAKGGELSDGSLNRCLASVALYKALGGGWEGIELPDVAADDSSATRQ